MPYFPGFSHPASAITMFYFTGDLFIISLHRKQITRFKPDDTSQFIDWLKKHHVTDADTIYREL